MTISHPEPVTAARLRSAARQPAADDQPLPAMPAVPAIPAPMGAPTPAPTPAAAARGGDVHPVIRRSGAPPAAVDLLTHAHRTLATARRLPDPLERYATAHLAALRTAAAVLAVRGRPEKDPRRRRAIRSAWEVLPQVAPELSEWAVYFAAGARRRAAAEAGITGAAGPRDADDLIRNTALFLRIAERLLGLHPRPPAPRRPPGGEGEQPGLG